MREVQNKWSTLKLNDDIWAKLIYFEQNRRLAKAYVSTPILTVDGSTSGLDGFRIGLSGIENSYRQLDSIGCLRSIGQGIKLKIDHQGNILIRKLAPPLQQQQPGGGSPLPVQQQQYCSVWIKEWPSARYAAKQRPVAGQRQASAGGSSSSATSDYSRLSSASSSTSSSSCASSSPCSPPSKRQPASIVQASFNEAALLNTENWPMQEIVDTNTSYKLFDMQKFRLLLERSRQQAADQRGLSSKVSDATSSALAATSTSSSSASKLGGQFQVDWRQCVSIISFVRNAKPATASSSRDKPALAKRVAPANGKQPQHDVLAEPCWLMLINIIAIDMLKSSICDMRPAPTAQTSALVGRLRQGEQTKTASQQQRRVTSASRAMVRRPLPGAIEEACEPNRVAPNRTQAQLANENGTHNSNSVAGFDDDDDDDDDDYSIQPLATGSALNRFRRPAVERFKQKMHASNSVVSLHSSDGREWQQIRPRRSSAMDEGEALAFLETGPALNAGPSLDDFGRFSSERLRRLNEFRNLQQSSLSSSSTSASSSGAHQRRHHKSPLQQPSTQSTVYKSSQLLLSDGSIYTTFTGKYLDKQHRMRAASSGRALGLGQARARQLRQPARNNPQQQQQILHRASLYPLGALTASEHRHPFSGHGLPSAVASHPRRRQLSHSLSAFDLTNNNNLPRLNLRSINSTSIKMNFDSDEDDDNGNDDLDVDNDDDYFVGEQLDLICRQNEAPIGRLTTDLLDTDRKGERPNAAVGAFSNSDWAAKLARFNYPPLSGTSSSSYSDALGGSSGNKATSEEEEEGVLLKKRNDKSEFDGQEFRVSELKTSSTQDGDDVKEGQVERKILEQQQQRLFVKTQNQTSTKAISKTREYAPTTDAGPKLQQNNVSNSSLASSSSSSGCPDNDYVISNSSNSLMSSATTATATSSSSASSSSSQSNGAELFSQPASSSGIACGSGNTSDEYEHRLQVEELTGAGEAVERVANGDAGEQNQHQKQKSKQVNNLSANDTDRHQRRSLATALIEKRQTISLNRGYNVKTVDFSAQDRFQTDKVECIHCEHFDGDGLQQIDSEFSCKLGVSQTCDQLLASCGRSSRAINVACDCCCDCGLYETSSRRMVETAIPFVKLTKCEEDALCDCGTADDKMQSQSQQHFYNHEQPLHQQRQKANQTRSFDDDEAIYGRLPRRGKFAPSSISSGSSAQPEEKTITQKTKNFNSVHSANRAVARALSEERDYDHIVPIPELNDNLFGGNSLDKSKKARLGGSSKELRRNSGWLEGRKYIKIFPKFMFSSNLVNSKPKAKQEAVGDKTKSGTLDRVDQVAGSTTVNKFLNRRTISSQNLSK